MQVFLIAVISADGFLAEATSQTSTDWTSKADKKFFSERTKQAGVIVMGSTTYKTIGHPLPGRINIIYTRHPESIPNSLPLTTNNYKLTTNSIYTTNLLPHQLIAILEKAGYTKVAICGGSNIYTLFLKSGLINNIYLTIEPIIFGQGIKLFDKPVLKRLHLNQVKKLSDQTILLEYTVMV